MRQRAWTIWERNIFEVMDDILRLSDGDQRVVEREVGCNAEVRSENINVGCNSHYYYFTVIMFIEQIMNIYEGIVSLSIIFGLEHIFQILLCPWLKFRESISWSIMDIYFRKFWRNWFTFIAIILIRWAERTYWSFRERLWGLYL